MVEWFVQGCGSQLAITARAMGHNVHPAAMP
jgi:hypothetical protein